MEVLSSALPSTREVSSIDVDGALHTLNSKIEDVKAQIYETINAHYNEFIATLNGTRDLQQQVDRLYDDLSSIRSSSLSKDVQAPLVSSASECEKMCQKLEHTEHIIASLDLLSKIHRGFGVCDANLECADYKSAAEQIFEMEKILSEIRHGADTGCDARIFKVVKEEFQKKKVKLSCRLDELLERSIVFEKQSRMKYSLKVSKQVSELADGTHYDNPTNISEIFEAFQTLGRLERKLRAFAQDLSNYLFEPLLAMPHLVPAAKTTGSDVTLSNIPDAENRTIASAEDIFARVTNVLMFLNTHVLDGNECVFGILGAMLWPLLFPKIIEHCLAKCIPNDSKDLSRCREVVTTVETFEVKLYNLGFLREEQRELSAYIRNMDIHCAEKMRREVLERAREIILRGDRNSSVVTNSTERGNLQNYAGGKGGKTGKGRSKDLKGGDADVGFFVLPTCRVTDSAQCLVEMAYNMLQEAASSPPSCAKDLFGASRDILDLFRAVYPARHAAVLASDPQACVLFHNDCMYIAHHLLTMGHQFQSSLSKVVGRCPTFVDMVPAFRDLGKRVFELQMKKQRTELLEPLRNSGLSGTNQDHRLASVEAAFKHVIHQLSTLSTTWQAILPSETYFCSIGLLLDVVAKFLIVQLEDLPDITEEETHHLSYLFRLLLNCEQFFTIPDKEDQKLPQEKVPCARFTPSWAKFQSITEVLDLDLATIIKRWEEKKLPGFSASELRGLVRALFAENDYTKGKLKLIH